MADPIAAIDSTIYPVSGISTCFAVRMLYTIAPCDGSGKEKGLIGCQQSSSPRSFAAPLLFYD
eukprot:2886792-Pleurochrysis_carterae.AAC.1